MARILMITAEATPLARCGGQGDFVRGLFTALARAGHDVRLFLPAYGMLSRDGVLPHVLDVPWGAGVRTCQILEDTFPETERPIYLVDEPWLFNRSGIYGDGPVDYPDNAERFGFLCRSALAWLLRLGWQPDVVQCHDWPAAPALVHMRTTYFNHPFFQNVAGLFTFQDLQFQGEFPAQAVVQADLPVDTYHSDALESWGRLNLLKGGTVFADFLNTVSPQYLREVQTLPDIGRSLERIFAQRHTKSAGILKGVEVEQWDPANDPFIAKKFSTDRMDGKSACRVALLKEHGLKPNPELPVLGLLSRFTVRRGIPVLLQILPRLLDLDIRLVVAGHGDPELDAALRAIAARNPTRMAVTGYQDIRVVHRLYAGCDMLLRPSVHEPCGVPPLEALRYGTLPVLRRVGGYVDSMIDVQDNPERGYAFTYQHPGPESIEAALQRAFALWRDKVAWSRARTNAMQCDFSWDRVASEYREVFDRMTAERRQPAVAGRVVRH